MARMNPITKRKVATRLVAYDPDMSKNPVRALKKTYFNRAQKGSDIQ